jgi:hypothetical protein
VLKFREVFNSGSAVTLTSGTIGSPLLMCKGSQTGREM